MLKLSGAAETRPLRLFGTGVFGAGGLEAILVDVVEGGHLEVLVFGKEAADVHAAIAAADESECDSGIGLRSADGLGANDRERGGGAGRADETTAGVFLVHGSALWHANEA